MTIAVAIRTGSAVVFAADSKLTTVGLEGFEEDGSPRWVDQTYDNATKVAHDRNKTLMAMAAGHASIGRVAATDFIARTSFANYGDAAAQDQGLAALVTSMVDEKRRFWADSQVSEEQWRGPTMILAAPGPDGIDPRVWRIDLEGAGSETEEILTNPGLWLEGSYEEAYTLLYGFNTRILRRIGEQVGVEPQRMWDAAFHPQGWLRPIDRINFWAMPLQDAVDLAVFLATVQVQMDRFLPGTPACGGPIDVMVLRMAPQPQIVVQPGKTLHHPQTTWLG